MCSHPKQEHVVLWTCVCSSEELLPSMRELVRRYLTVRGAKRIPNWVEQY